MPELPPILIAALTGFLSGLLLSIPVGPVNLTIMNEGARRGFKWAALIGLGASVMEVIYCAIAFTGFASFFSRGYVKAVMELASFVFLLGLGMKLLLVKTVSSENPVEAKIETKLKPHSAFMIGFVRVMGNPGVLLFWIILAANFISREWVAPTWDGKGACILGVALGTSLWFMGLSWAVSLGHRKFSDKVLLRMEKGSGIGLLALGAIHGVQIVWEMVQHHKQ
ncbi:MAG: Lysine exporter protein [Pedosphaera sp.]|nr:Lysine exporter protein [Pedosphaera sp.]